MKCMANGCGEEFKAGDMTVPVYEFVSGHMSSKELKVYAARAILGFVHIQHIESSLNMWEKDTRYPLVGESLRTDPPRDSVGYVKGQMS